MEIVTTESEQRLVEILPVIEQDAGSWMYVHVNIATMHDLLLRKEGLSKESLKKIHAISVQIAEKLVALGLDGFEGNILIFEDSDVLALFIKKSATVEDVLKKMRGEFDRNGLMHLLAIEEMKDKLTQLIIISKEKEKAAAEYRMKWHAVEAAEKILAHPQQDADVLRMIQKKRRERKSGCVLIIEDDVLTRGLLTTLLKGESEVVTAKDAQGGITAYIDSAPDMVFLDIHLPGMDGHEILKRIMRLDPDAHVIMLSGDSARDNVLSSHSHGAAGFVCKPFSKEKILEYVRQCPLKPPAADELLGAAHVRDHFKI